MTDVTTLPLNELEVSEEFRAAGTAMGFRTLNDILETPPAVLIAAPGFSYRWLAELSSLLSRHGLLHRLQPLRENTGG